MASLSRSELERYDRQISIRGWGVEGQKKIKSSRVIVVGVGGLGTVSSLYLAAAGVGELILIDSDKVSLSDLNRQILYSEDVLGLSKVDVAKTKIQSLNSEVKVEAIMRKVTKENVNNLIKDADVVVDGLDNWSTRFIVNSRCVEKEIPFVHAGVSEFYGQITTVMPREGPCLRCIFPEKPRQMKKIPILGATPGLLASMQVMEVIKILTGIGKPLIGRLLFIDGEGMICEEAEIKRNPNCPVCGSY
ncbi:HesA/MoeB/ThiF family protein [Candidatus Bathyarchaeota archaeon]|nr:MAG: HesA/MoeB/ThiF family protein [Candidatus Bathyarchaeota archaeon]